MGALAWVANLAADRGRPMTAGMVVITGSVITTVDIAPASASTSRSTASARRRMTAA